MNLVVRVRGGSGGTAAGGSAGPPRARPGYLIGAKVVARSGGRDLARVHLARDAPESVVSPVRRLAAAWHVPVTNADSTTLGRRCGLDHPVAALGELKAPGDPADS
jgi:hypothetical protein